MYDRVREIEIYFCMEAIREFQHEVVAVNDVRAIVVMVTHKGMSI